MADDAFAAPFDGEYDESLDAALLIIDSGITRTVSRQLAALRLEALDAERELALAETEAQSAASRAGLSGHLAAEAVREAQR